MGILGILPSPFVLTYSQSFQIILTAFLTGVATNSTVVSRARVQAARWYRNSIEETRLQEGDKSCENRSRDIMTR